MAAYLFVAIFTVGSFLIPTVEPAVLAQINDNSILTKTIDKIDEVDSENTVNNATRVVVIEDIEKMLEDDKQYCSVFPPAECFNNGKPDALKNDVEVFQEQFCPGRRSFKCMEEFARRCLSSGAHYYDFIIRVLARNNVVLQLDLCTNAPYEKENLRHAECLRFGKLLYNENCPHKFKDGRNNVTSVGLTLQNYVQCVVNIVRVACGEDTALFLKEYTFALNISSYEHGHKLIPMPRFDIF